MNYLQEIEAGLRIRLETAVDLNDETAVRWLEDTVSFVRNAVQTSYQNGQIASKPIRRTGSVSALTAGKLKPVDRVR